MNGPKCLITRSFRSFRACLRALYIVLPGNEVDHNINDIGVELLAPVILKFFDRSLCLKRSRFLAREKTRLSIPMWKGARIPPPICMVIAERGGIVRIH